MGSSPGSPGPIGRGGSDWGAGLLTGPFRTSWMAETLLQPVSLLPAGDPWWDMVVVVRERVYTEPLLRGGKWKAATASCHSAAGSSPSAGPREPGEPSRIQAPQLTHCAHRASVSSSAQEDQWGYFCAFQVLLSSPQSCPSQACPCPEENSSQAHTHARFPTVMDSTSVGARGSLPRCQISKQCCTCLAES